GFTNVTDRCLNLNIGSVCNNPDEYLFWDEQHPTSRAHQILGDYAYQRLQDSYQSVPEPSVVSAMVTLGILSVGGVIQRQQKIARKTASRVSQRQASLTIVRNSVN
ncbi:PEP-CTERM sorting domain-containing protein, partial [Nostoc sp. NIES-2111]